ncbi:MAG: tetratricopeptide repeat protein [Bryobacteraceae bacterium]
MSRWALLLLAAGVCLAEAQSAPSQQPPPNTTTLKKERPPQATGAEEDPPEEDTSLSVDSYAFNPLQSKKSVDIGNEYAKKRNFRAAAGRYKEATKWNDGNSEAWLRLGEAEEKLKDPQSARAAYAKYLELASDAKNAPEIRKKLAKLK